MLADKIRILDFDNSLIEQKNLINRFKPVISDLKKIAPICRHWMNEKSAGLIKEQFDPAFKNAITFLGSGDFHYISSVLIQQFKQPLSIIVFDHHPDWDILPPKFGCGSWVSRALEMENVKKVILLGISSDDISTISIQSGNLAALKNNRLEIYPYSHKPTKVFLRNVPENISLKQQRGFMHTRIHWQELKDKNLEVFFRKLLKRIPTREVYISIDKDCLNSKYSLTNWEEGSFDLSQLLLMLKLVKENLDIVGLDITGEYSKPEHRNKLRTLISRLDHPKNYTAKSKPANLVNSVNEQTNIKIIELLLN